VKVTHDILKPPSMSRVFSVAVRRTLFVELMSD